MRAAGCKVQRVRNEVMKRRMFSVNPEAANNKTLYYISRCSLLQVLTLPLQRKYIKNDSEKE